jgi:hypothetical protein
MKDLSESVLALVHVLHEGIEQRENEFEWQVSRLATKQDLQEMEKRIMASESQVIAALQKIDAATTATAANLQIVSDTDATISTELDALVAALKNAGVSQALVDQADALSTKVQASSDTLAAQIPVLQAIAAKGVLNPVPVPVPAPPAA